MILLQKMWFCISYLFDITDLLYSHIIFNLKSFLHSQVITNILVCSPINGASLLFLKKDSFFTVTVLRLKCCWGSSYFLLSELWSCRDWWFYTLEIKVTFKSRWSIREDCLIRRLTWSQALAPWWSALSASVFHWESSLLQTWLN